MNQEKLLSIMDIAGELNSGTATLKFILKRFSNWLPFEHIDGHPCYSRNVIPVLIKIQESLATGLLPSEIDLELETGTRESADPIESGQTTSDPAKSAPSTGRDFLEHPNQDIRVSKDGLTLIKSLFDDIAIQQNRVAAAHEKRAEAEERKAAAIEKRAEAEEKKAIAMNHIASALQEMNHNRRLDSQEIAHKAAQVLSLDETIQDMDLAEFEEPHLQDTRLENIGSTQQQDDTEIFDSPDPSIDLLEASEIQLDDLYDLIQEDIFLEDSLEEAFEMDDLSQLLDEPLTEPADLDDLSALIDTVSTQAPPETDLYPDDSSPLDDLSLLIEDRTSLETPELDDLSLLIEVQSTQKPQPPMELDDLSALITSDAAVPDSVSPMADSLEDSMDATLDDLSALIEDAPSLKPDITPQENLKDYKAAVMKIILDLKTKNLSPEETTRRLNQEGVQTISGKSQWSEKAIFQIYKFIDSAT